MIPMWFRNPPIPLNSGLIGSQRPPRRVRHSNHHPSIAELGTIRTMSGEGAGSHRRVMREDLKRPPGNIRRPAGLKIACFRNGPVRPGYGRLASASERRESKVRFHQRNKQVVAGRTLFIPFQLPLSLMRVSFALKFVTRIISWQSHFENKSRSAVYAGTKESNQPCST
jgi:hypothetical protein